MPCQPIAPLALLIIIAGCAHEFTLHPRQGGERGTGVATTSDRTVTITLDGKTSKGTYIFDGGNVVISTTTGSATAYSGARSATALGSGQTSTYIPGSGNGRILAIATDGDAIRCEFQFSRGSGLGLCHDNAGKGYDMLIHK
jgi:hypothetical protein